MIEIMSNCLTRGKVAKIILLVLVLFILILTISPQNALAEENNQVNASEILGNISRGVPVEVTNCVIIGDLDVSDLRKDLEIIEIWGIKRRIVESPIKIKDSTIQGNVYFNPIYFNDEVKFENVTFEGEAFFGYATFNKSTFFQDSTFKNKANFGEATFNEGAYFSRVKFNYAWFWNATFNNNAFFDSATFEVERAIFCNAIFVKEANFYNCTFNEFTDFFNATFNNLACFQWATFNGPVSFKNATFNDMANFPDVTFNDEAHFQNARFNDKAEFSFAKFKDRAYFTGASFNDTVDFSEADIFLTMKIRWSQLEGKLAYNGYFYQSLIRNFETLGQSDDANGAYYKYKVEKRKHLKSPLDPLWNGLEAGVGCIISLFGSVLEFIDFGFRRPLEYIFLDLSCGYGVKPLNPLGCAVIIILLFACFYRLIEDKENNKSHSDSSLKDRILKFVFLSVSIFTTLGLLNNWKTAEDHKTWFHFLAIMEALLGWLIMALFVISLTMTWIR